MGRTKQTARKASSPKRNAARELRSDKADVAVQAEVQEHHSVPGGEGGGNNHGQGKDTEDGEDPGHSEDSGDSAELESVEVENCGFFVSSDSDDTSDDHRTTRNTSRQVKRKRQQSPEPSDAKKQKTHHHRTEQSTDGPMTAEHTDNIANAIMQEIMDWYDNKMVSQGYLAYSRQRKPKFKFFRIYTAGAVRKCLRRYHEEYAARLHQLTNDMKKTKRNIFL